MMTNHYRIFSVLTEKRPSNAQIHQLDIGLKRKALTPAFY
jgi:hypothetical protein